MRRLSGHYWTLAPFVRERVAGPPPPPSRHFRAEVHDPHVGRLVLRGRLAGEGSDELVVIVHGLGGSVASGYALAAARAARRAGMASLRLNLRGADRSGQDFYHAGLTADLHASLGSGELRRFSRIYLLGYSLGGHIALRYATEDPDPRVRAVAAVCPPIDLEAGARSIDRRRKRFYRDHLLRGLKEMYAELAARGRAHVPNEEAQAIRTISEWDERIVAPRHGFASAEDYWRRATVAPHLPSLGVPTLVVAATHDPMVPVDTVREPLASASSVRLLLTPVGGHVGFPPELDLGLGAEGTVEDQILSWLRAPA